MLGVNERDKFNVTIFMSGIYIYILAITRWFCTDGQANTTSVPAAIVPFKQ